MLLTFTDSLVTFMSLAKLTERQTESPQQSPGLPFDVAGGSVRGREHQRLLRNNQDAFAWRLDNDLTVAAVADGCSSGEFSEVGAQLAVRWVIDGLPTLKRDLGAGNALELAEATCDQLAKYLERLVVHHPFGSPTRAAFVESLLLFTLLVAVIDINSVTVFGIGDGVLSLNGDPVALEAGAGNCPDYLAYRLLPESLTRPGDTLSQPRVHLQSQTRSLESLVIATDGCIGLLRQPDALLRDEHPMGGLDQFERQSRYLRNPSLIQKRLTVIGELNGRLSDDTTLVLIRRREGQPCRS